MIRSAAKNHERVAVVVDPADYARVLGRARRSRRGLGGARASSWRARRSRTPPPTTAPSPSLPGPARRSRRRALADFPETLHLELRAARACCATARTRTRRRRSTSLDGAPGGPSLARAEVLQGKELSYNNMLDLDAACACAPSSRRRRRRSSSTTTRAARPSPTRASPRPTGARARPIRCRRSAASSPCNRPVDGELAREMAETFLECVIAPGFTRRGAGRCSRRRRTCGCSRCDIARRARAARSSCAASPAACWCRRATRHRRGAAGAKVVTKRAPTADELRDLDFAWRVVQAREVERHRVRRAAARTLGHRRGPDVARRLGAHRRVARRARRCRARSLASDAFFPFRDGVDEAAKAGAAAVIQPGGSVRDAEVDRRRRRARHRDGVHRRAPLPALAPWASVDMGFAILLVGSGGREHALAWKLAAEPAVRARSSSRPATPASRRGPKVARACPSRADADRRAGRGRRRRAARRPGRVRARGAAGGGPGRRLRARGHAVLRPVARGGRDRGLEGVRQAADARRRRAHRGVRRASTTSARPRRSSTRSRAPWWSRPTAWPRARAWSSTSTQAEAKAAVRAMLAERAFGDGGRARGDRGAPHRARGLDDGALRRRRASRCWRSAEDHKAVGDGDAGPNTGGMGAVLAVAAGRRARWRRASLRDDVRARRCARWPRRGGRSAGCSTAG